MTAASTSHDVAAPLTRDTAVPLSRYIIFFGLALGGCAIESGDEELDLAKLGMPGGRTLWLWDNYIRIPDQPEPGGAFRPGARPGLVVCEPVIRSRRGNSVLAVPGSAAATATAGSPSPWGQSWPAFWEISTID